MRPGERSPGTIGERKRVWVAFSWWTEVRGLNARDVPGLRAWIAEGVEIHLKPSYLLNIVTHVSLMLKEVAGGSLTPAEEKLLTTTRDQLKSIAPFSDVDQPDPASPQDVMLLEAIAPMGWGLFTRVIWHAAARASDWLDRLPVENVQMFARGWVRVHYREKKELARRGAIRTVLVRLPMSAWDRLMILRSSRKPGEAIFHGTTAQFDYWIRKYGFHLSAKSFRRGSILTMLDSDVPEREIRRLTGHASEMTLLQYCQREPTTAIGAMQMAFAALC